MPFRLATPHCIRPLTEHVNVARSPSLRVTHVFQALYDPHSHFRRDPAHGTGHVHAHPPYDRRTLHLFNPCADRDGRGKALSAAAFEREPLQSSRSS